GVGAAGMPRGGSLHGGAWAWKRWMRTMRWGCPQEQVRAGTVSMRKGRGEAVATAAAQDGSQDDGRDLTGRASIRNAGLHIFAANGFAGTPLRSIAAEAGVAIGLISHHSGSTDGRREAVEGWIIDLMDTAITPAD